MVRDEGNANVESCTAVDHKLHSDGDRCHSQIQTKPTYSEGDAGGERVGGKHDNKLDDMDGSMQDGV